MAAVERDIKAFLFARMYRHPQLNRMRAEADLIVRDLYAAYVERPQEAPAFWAARRAALGPERATADYVAGMTDRFALNEHRRLFDPQARLR
jgi:dGTPase